LEEMEINVAKEDALEGWTICEILLSRRPAHKKSTALEKVIWA